MLMTGLSGNEIYCLAQLGYGPGNIVVGNSVHSLGLVRGITSGLKTLAGGEISSVTQLIVDGRHAAINRLEKEAQEDNARGLTGVTSELRQIGNLMEFIALGSSVDGGSAGTPFFSTACTGQDLYCQMDAGYEPRHFVMGNVAYALGIGRGISGGLKMIARRGEIKEFSNMYNHTRHLALERLEAEAAERGCNAVVDIITKILPFGVGVREMLMVGTGSHNPALGQPKIPVTSELTGEELWNLTQLGYAPLRLVLGTSVYALGLAGGIGAFFQSFARGEINGVTRLVYDARENCLDHIRLEAEELRADGVIGVKLFIYELGGGLVEVMAIGTAIRKHAAVHTRSDQIIPQAIIRDRDTFFDEPPTVPGAPKARSVNRA
ncbi:heavy metal-binding domain-containing protein [Aquisphaera insulae]|uniref:heavy metal-binding domain-containing protein n=1 Tax=Aquisphaera insulae TaxID=2712864 RepID=UPI0013EDF468|nr:heavy metal-binding domain-containing protein [Aquisphaera insulae]